MNVGISLAMSRRKIWTINILVLETMSQVRMSVFFQTVDSMSSKRLIFVHQRCSRSVRVLLYLTLKWIYSLSKSEAYVCKFYYIGSN